jgi:hypothetical protein
MFSIFRRRNTNQWYWQLRMDLPVDFAVWVLESDGLQVPPFNKHPEILGNKILRDLGFTADRWQIWLNHLVGESVREHQRPTSDNTKPGDFFRGINKKWQTKLNELWGLYLPISNSRRYVEYVISMQIPQKSSEGHILLNTLNEVRGNLPPLQVTLNAYPAKIELPVAPSTLLLSPGGAMISAEDWETILINGIQSLHGM